jgi:hypothetical protein
MIEAVLRNSRNSLISTQQHGKEEFINRIKKWYGDIAWLVTAKQLPNLGIIW